MNDKPFFITFYSCRGGAERLLALVNVGVDLARRGRKVLLVDFDLESPGLTALATLRPEQPHSGLVEFVAEYLDTNQAPPVSEYLYRAASIGKKGGELWLMPAGKEDPDYWAVLGRIDWQQLYDLARVSCSSRTRACNGNRKSSPTMYSSTPLAGSTTGRPSAPASCRTW